VDGLGIWLITFSYFPLPPVGKRMPLAPLFLIPCLSIWVFVSFISIYQGKSWALRAILYTQIIVVLYCVLIILRLTPVSLYAIGILILNPLLICIFLDSRVERELESRNRHMRHRAQRNSTPTKKHT